MESLRAKITSKGQVTLPKPLREALGIHEGDQIEFMVSVSGNASFRKLQPLCSSAGILRHLAGAKPASVDEMNRGIRRVMHGKHDGK